MDWGRFGVSDPCAVTAGGRGFENDPAPPRRGGQRLDAGHMMGSQCGGRGASQLAMAASDRLETAAHLLDPCFTEAFPATGAGPSVKLNRVIESPAYSPGLGSYSLAGLRLLYSAGNPTWRIDPMSFTYGPK